MRMPDTHAKKAPRQNITMRISWEDAMAVHRHLRILGGRRGSTSPCAYLGRTPWQYIPMSEDAPVQGAGLSTIATDWWSAQVALNRCPLSPGFVLQWAKARGGFLQRDIVNTRDTVNSGNGQSSGEETSREEGRTWGRGGGVTGARAGGGGQPFHQVPQAVHIVCSHQPVYLVRRAWPLCTAACVSAARRFSAVSAAQAIRCSLVPSLYRLQDASCCQLQEPDEACGTASFHEGRRSTGQLFS